MNKKLQTAIVTIFLFARAFGQTSNPAPEIKEVKNPTQTYLEPILNLVSTNLNYGSSNTAVADYKKRVLGVQVGASFQAGITPNFSLVPEFYFMMKGGKLNANNPLTGSQTTFRLYSLELPVLARVHIGKAYVNAGPSIAYNLAGNKKIEEVSKSIAFNRSLDGFKRFEAGIQMGGGYMFPLKEKRMAVDIRYNHGLTNISNNKEIYNRSIVLSLHISKPWKTNPFAKSKTL